MTGFPGARSWRGWSPQYTRNDAEFTRGVFRVRGETIDIFPAESAELALRLTLFDDEIESLELFDPLTGRIRQKLPASRCTRFALRNAARYRPARHRDDQEELRERVKRYVDDGHLVEAQRLSSAPASIWKCAGAGASKTIRGIYRAPRQASRRPH